MAFCIGATASHRAGRLEAPRPLDRGNGRSGRESEKGLEPLASRTTAWLKTNSVQRLVFAGARSQGHRGPHRVGERVEVRFNPQPQLRALGVGKGGPVLGAGSMSRTPIQCTPQWGAKANGRGWKREGAYLLSQVPLKISLEFDSSFPT